MKTIGREGWRESNRKKTEEDLKRVCVVLCD